MISAQSSAFLAAKGLTSFVIISTSTNSLALPICLTAKCHTIPKWSEKARTSSQACFKTPRLVEWMISSMSEGFCRPLHSRFSLALTALLRSWLAISVVAVLASLRTLHSGFIDLSQHTSGKTHLAYLSASSADLVHNSAFVTII